MRLRRLGNISAGSTSHRIAEKDIHPDNHSLAERAAAALRLDVAGVDAIFPDISRSWLETGAHICEVNAQPQFGPGASRELLPKLLEGDGRIPVMIVVGRGENVDWSQFRNRPGTGKRLGFASIDGAWLGEGQLTGKLETAFQGAQILRDNAMTDVAVIVMSPGEVRKLGLPLDACNILLLEDPESWQPDDLSALPQILEIALPHAEKAVSTGRVDALVMPERSAERTVSTTRSKTLQGACEELLCELLR